MQSPDYTPPYFPLSRTTLDPSPLADSLHICSFLFSYILPLQIHTGARSLRQVKNGRIQRPVEPPSSGFVLHTNTLEVIVCIDPRGLSTVS